MTHATEAHAAKAAEIKIIEQVLKQKQKVMDLDTGNENAEIELVMTKYIAPEYDAKKFAPLTEDEFNQVLAEKAAELIQPVSEQTKAFLTKATSDSYQTAKSAALAKGNYLSSDLKARIIQVMRGNVSFADVPAKDCFDRWKAGYLSDDAKKKASATRILQIATDMGGFGDDL